MPKLVLRRARRPEVTPKEPKAPEPVCRYLGDPTGGSKKCRLCSSRSVMLPVYRCNYYDQDVTTKIVGDGSPNCQQCDYRLGLLDRAVVKVIIPWRYCPTRAPGLAWVKAFYESIFGAGSVVIDEEPTSSGPYNKARSINRACRSTVADVLVIADADCVVKRATLETAVELAAEGAALVLPHSRTYLTTPDEARRVLAQDPKEGNTIPFKMRGKVSPGGIWVIDRSTFLAHQLDERFEGWGDEDREFIRRVGYTRLDDTLVHIHHRPAPRVYWPRNKVLKSPGYAILTSLFSAYDPQRRKTFNPVGVVDSLAESLKGDEYRSALYVFHNQLSRLEADRLVSAYPVRLKRVSMRDPNPYRARWLVYLDWLRSDDGAWVKWLWIVDGGDVEALRATWSDLKSDTLYVGHESAGGFDWLRKQHPSAPADLEGPLYNAGVVGGSRDIVVTFLARLVKLFDERDLTDMAAINVAARGFQVHYGPDVVTDFKAYRDNGVARWRHK